MSPLKLALKFNSRNLPTITKNQNWIKVKHKFHHEFIAYQKYIFYTYTDLILYSLVDY